VFAAALVVLTSISALVLRVRVSDLNRYLGAAAGIMSSIEEALQRRNINQLREVARRDAVADLTSILRISLAMKLERETAKEDISTYIDLIERTGINSASRALWLEIISNSSKMLHDVFAVLSTVQKGKWLPLVLEELDTTVLKSILLGDIPLTGKLSYMSPPETSDEIQQLVLADEYYRRVLDTFERLSRMAERFSSVPTSQGVKEGGARRLCRPMREGC
jgi:hypothetical protein